MSRSPLVLIANDQEWAARSLETILTGEGYDVVRAHTGTQALARASERMPDAVLLDQQMPDFTGTQVCRLLREDPRFGANLPILVTTAGPAGRPNRLSAFEAGAWDFVTQPFDGEMLLLKLRGFIAAKVATDRLRDHGLVDDWTGLYNPQGFLRRANEMSSEAARRRSGLACLLITPVLPDVDVEAAADAERQVSSRVADALRRTARRTDAVGRLAPLRFGVLTALNTPDGFRRLWERFLQAARTDGRSGDSGAAPFGLRGGVSAYLNGAVSMLNPQQLLERAAEALALSSSEQPLVSAAS